MDCVALARAVSLCLDPWTLVPTAIVAQQQLNLVTLETFG